MREGSRHLQKPSAFLTLTAEGSLVCVRDGWLLRVGGGQREPEDQRGDREAAAEGQEGLSEGAEAAAAG